MGMLTYDNALRTEFDDRLLAHLQAVMGLKLRRAESFYFTWQSDAIDGGGRTTIWIDPHIPLAFHYTTPVAPHLDDDWLSELSESADSEGGLLVGIHFAEGRSMLQLA